MRSRIVECYDVLRLDQFSQRPPLPQRLHRSPENLAKPIGSMSQGKYASELAFLSYSFVDAPWRSVDHYIATRRQPDIVRIAAEWPVGRGPLIFALQGASDPTC